MNEAMGLKLTRVIGGFRAATVVLTRIPMGSAPLRVEDQVGATAWFPIVGAAIGATLGLVYELFRGVGALPAATLAMIAGLMITGALHEDGLADTADALGGASTKERLFVILKDSRTGAFGVAAVAVTLLLRVSLLAALGAAGGWALVLVHSGARLVPVALMAALPYVTEPSKQKNGALERPTPARAALAGIPPLGFLLLVVGLGWLDVLGAVLFVTMGGLAALLCGYRFAQRAGGYTGDFLGAAEQVAECALLLSIAISVAR